VAEPCYWFFNFISLDSFIFFFHMATVIPDVSQFFLFFELKHSLQTILHYQRVQLDAQNTPGINVKLPQKKHPRFKDNIAHQYSLESP